MVLLAYRHALRASEVTGLLLSDVRLSDRQIVVRRLKGSLTNVQDLADLSGEPLLSERRMLARWLKERGDNASLHLFPSQKGARLSKVQFYRLFRDAARKAGLPEARGSLSPALFETFARRQANRVGRIAWPWSRMR